MKTIHSSHIKSKRRQANPNVFASLGGLTLQPQWRLAGIKVEKKEGQEHSCMMNVSGG